MEQSSLNLEEGKYTFECFGMKFSSELERREFFRNQLRKKLADLKQTEGFPIGKDEDIIALSDPPYFTACPNPWMENIIDTWNENNTNLVNDIVPFVADVSEGKTDAIYKSHSYHTKVPYKAIMRYLLHYTKPGDIVFDGFAGTGMTGVATQMCSIPQAIMDLGYTIENGVIKDRFGERVSDFGERKAVISDLSPAAFYISSNFNRKIDSVMYESELSNKLKELKKKVEWLYQTDHNGLSGGKINYFVWSDLFVCPNCTQEIVYWDIAVDSEDDTEKTRKEMYCSHCKLQVNKNNLEKSWETTYDKILKREVRLAKQKLVSINYTFNKKRYNKAPSKFDYNLIKKIDDYELENEVPIHQLPIGHNTNQPFRSHGIKYVHQFYTKRSLIVLSEYMNIISNSDLRLEMLMALTGVAYSATKLYRWTPNYQGGGPLSGTLYIPSLYREVSTYDALKRFSTKLPKNITFEKKENNVINCLMDATQNVMNNNSVDYIFVDPPFGANIMYSELNTIWEAWLKVFTNNKNEAIVNSSQGKNNDDYHYLMYKSFNNFYNVLKPGKWMTVIFSNSQASIWNVIQDAIQKAGFVIANVSALDKKQGSFKAVTSTIAVKQDLVISAYKPSEQSVKKMRNVIHIEESVWEFMDQHLTKLPIFVGSKGKAEVVSERTPRILFDRIVAFHVQNGIHVPMSSAEFQEKTIQKYLIRDGMVFLESQVYEYDKKRILAKEFAQQSLFVGDENSAIEWLRQQLMRKPQTRQDIHPQFMKEIQHIAKHEELPELDDLLSQNFLMYDGRGNVPSQINTYLIQTYHDLRGLAEGEKVLNLKAINRWYVPNPNKQADLEKIRERSLLREFHNYLGEFENSPKKIKTFRTEAIRAGFKQAWTEKNYEKIINIGNRLSEKVIQEDDKLLMYYDNAQVRLGL